MASNELLAVNILDRLSLHSMVIDYEVKGC